MAESQIRRTTQDKISLFRACFTGLSNVYGTYDMQGGQVRQVKQPVTDKVILRHLQGHQPYGVYLLAGDQTRAVVADFDDKDMFSPLEFVRQADHYGIKAYVERSKRKGWHVWIFAELPGVPAIEVRLVVKAILNDIGKPSTEIFPKQDRLNGNTSYGNFINAPLFGCLVPRGKTVFVDPDNGFRPYPKQWDFLENIQRVPESILNEIIEINDITAEVPAALTTSSESSDIHLSFGLPPCAKKMLAEGVSEYQRVLCFRLAVHLKKAGLPQDLSLAALNAWASKNNPEGDKQIITGAEIIEQTNSAYSKDYRACGCEDPAVTPYCHPSCPLHSRNREGAQPANKNATKPSDSEAHPVLG